MAAAASVDVFPVLLVGAGEINFGSVEGPWNHTLRLERKLGTRLRIVGLVDPDTARAELVLASKRAEPEVAAAYANTSIYQSVSEAGKSLPQVLSPRLVILGVPPFARGTDEPGRDLELQVAEYWPKCTLLVEKPVSSGSIDAPRRVAVLLESKKSMTVGVGYMLRYLKAVQKIKNIIDENNLTVMGTNARYVMAYEWARKVPWWDKTRSGGPIVEQATHFCDLARYFGGAVDLATITVHTVEHDDVPGRLRAQRFDESVIPPENRIPRLTSASWQYQSGAVGSLMHVVALHGNTYDTELEVFADGYRIKLMDPYNSPKVSVRQPGRAEEEIFTFPGDDPFFSEISAFVDATDDPLTRSPILSTYIDAVDTYEFTCMIKAASDKAAQIRRHAKPGSSA